ncbi:MAG: hypothetical protein QNJ18_04430 [Xenococcaceae cyanobacterium MO_167.B52]|nr:hypothetical protein [Xenococcaceae cyanobacterium MO_167.B52]
MVEKKAKLIGLSNHYLRFWQCTIANFPDTAIAHCQMVKHERIKLLHYSDRILLNKF